MIIYNISIPYTVVYQQVYQVYRCTDDIIVKGMRPASDSLIIPSKKKANNDYIDNLLTTLETEKRRHYYFATVRKLQRDPKKSKNPFRLTDKETNTPIIDCNEQLKRITEHYQKFFNTAVPNPPLEAFSQQFLNQPLDNPITSEEIYVAAQSLINEKATGPDQLPAEALKYIDISEFHTQLAAILNNMFITSQTIEATQNAYLCPFKKT